VIIIPSSRHPGEGRDPCALVHRHLIDGPASALDPGLRRDDSQVTDGGWWNDGMTERLSLRRT
jgi:hypothetical protein